MLEKLLLGAAGIVLLLFLIWVLKRSFIIVQQGSVAVISRFGKYSRLLSAGLHFRLPVGDKVHRVFSQTKQVLTLRLTGDIRGGVPVRVVVDLEVCSVIDTETVKGLAYQLADPRQHLDSKATAHIRELLLPLTEEEVRTQAGGGALAEQLKERLAEVTAECGYELLDVRVPSVLPEESIHQANLAAEEAAVRRKTETADAAHQNQLLAQRAESEAAAQNILAQAEQGRLKGEADALLDVLEKLTGVHGMDAPAAAQVAAAMLHKQAIAEVATNAKGQVVLLPPGFGSGGDVTLPAIPSGT